MVDSSSLVFNLVEKVEYARAKLALVRLVSIRGIFQVGYLSFWNEIAHFNNESL
jgi:hypothetical protein